MKTLSQNKELQTLESLERKAGNRIKAKKVKINKSEAELKRQWIFGEITQDKYYEALNIVTTFRNSDKVIVSKKTKTTQTFRRKNLGKLSEQERRERGLVTAKRPGIVYTLLDDNTKVCRCCQDRKPANFFSNLQVSIDNKMAICKDCDFLKGKTYNAEKKLHKE